MFSLGQTMEFLIGNPFSTPVGQRIERATSALLQSEDWGLNMEICDIINETDDGPRDAVKAIKRRIIGNKNFREIMLALTVLEACVKNCGHRFHVLVASQDFTEGVLVRTILPKNNPPTALHDRVLSLIQSWADAFRSSPSLAGVVYVYEDLRRRGLEFPMTDLDALSPIHTPHREQRLRSELSLVKGNLTVMSEMLNQMTPGDSQQEDTELLQQLYSVCRSMQTRVIELIPQLLHEGLIEELLVVNDDLNNAFIRYERFERLSKAQSTTTEQQRHDSGLSLIDLSPMPQAVSQPAVIKTTSQPAVIKTTSQSAVSTLPNERQATSHTAAEEEFDMFAQTRGSSLAEQRKSVRYEDPGAVEGLAGALDTRLQVTGVNSSKQNSALDDTDGWLPYDMQGQSAVCEGVSSEDFDKFLDQRGGVSDHSGQTSRSVLHSTTRPPPQSTRRQQTTHDQLFSL
ncbi:target of Myb1 membrane trafficking protein-like isoform X4 [Lampris incognitus]|uniref:target of Myb1 membrane trafficking protein-like isoform X4 n=1 Tax=Lampris incognitus TaxID=2546036 RepID=UPI0024B5EE72|nr:target of Myb1 membrane trafficking protein-like isoform X4 [Lampris incognitus]